MTKEICALFRGPKNDGWAFDRTTEDGLQSCIEATPSYRFVFWVEWDDECTVWCSPAVSRADFDRWCDGRYERHLTTRAPVLALKERVPPESNRVRPDVDVTDYMAAVRASAKSGGG